MTRILAVGGVHLDRAWPELGAEMGDAMRQWAPTVLAEVVEAARDLEAEHLVIVGDLFARDTTVPATVEFAATLLGSLSRPVLIAPGQEDWYGDGSPYTYGPWSETVSVARSTAFAETPSGSSVWLSAWTSPVPRPVSLPDGRNADRDGWVVRSGQSAPEYLSAQLPPRLHLITSGGAASNSAHTVLPALVRPEATPAVATLITSNEGVVQRESVPLSPSPLKSSVFDVSEAADDTRLRDDLTRVASSDGLTVVHLIGTLRLGVLPPSLHANPLPSRLVVDESELSYSAERPEVADHTTMAEFLRAMDGVGTSPRDRHVATTLGIQALASAES